MDGWAVAAPVFMALVGADPGQSQESLGMSNRGRTLIR